MDNRRAMIESIEREMEEFTEPVGVCKGANEIINKNMRRWYGQMKRMKENRMAKREFKIELTDAKRVRNHLREIESRREILGCKGVTVKRSVEIVYVRSEWVRGGG